ncbi:MAG: hypothetical protein AAF696_39535, partial [Bacteroidota bacterium]
MKIQQQVRQKLSYQVPIGIAVVLSMIFIVRVETDIPQSQKEQTANEISTEIQAPIAEALEIQADKAAQDVEEEFEEIEISPELVT